MSAGSLDFIYDVTVDIHKSNEEYEQNKWEPCLPSGLAKIFCYCQEIAA